MKKKILISKRTDSPWYGTKVYDYYFFYHSHSPMKNDIEEMHRRNMLYNTKKSEADVFRVGDERRKWSKNIQWTLNDIKKRPGAMFLIPYTHSIYIHTTYIYRDNKNIQNSTLFCPYPVSSREKNSQNRAMDLMNDK